MSTGETWSDAWFLAAAQSSGRRRVTLVEILSNGDYLNHAILTREEIQHAVRRLVNDGLLTVEGADSFRVTSRGHMLVRESTRGWTASIERMAVALDALVPAASSQGRVDWRLDRSSYEAACIQYTRKFDEEVQRLERMPRPVRAIVMLFWVVVIRVWQTLRR